jgi:hypothetical protein
MQRGSGLHAFLVKDGHMSYKVGNSAKVHAKEKADNLDGAFLRVISVVTQKVNMWGISTTFTGIMDLLKQPSFMFHKCLFSMMFKIIVDN